MSLAQPDTVVYRAGVIRISGTTAFSLVKYGYCSSSATVLAGPGWRVQAQLPFEFKLFNSRFLLISSQETWRFEPLRLRLRPLVALRLCQCSPHWQYETRATGTVGSPEPGLSTGHCCTLRTPRRPKGTLASARDDSGPKVMLLGSASQQHRQLSRQQLPRVQAQLCSVDRVDSGNRTSACAAWS